MASILKVNNRDLSSYLRVAHGEGMDPADPDYAEPQFSGSAAFSEGQASVGEAVGNREMVFPLMLRDPVAEHVIGSLEPSLYWTLGASGASDRSGTGADGTGAGGITIGGSAEHPGVSEDGSSTDFDGSDDRITSTFAPFVNGSARTFAGWAYRDASADNEMLFRGTDANAPQLYITSAQTVTWDVEQGVGSTVTWAAAWPGNAQWVHWALVFDDTANTAALYINGALVSSQAATEAYGAAPGNFQLSATGTNCFDGKMAHVAVFERELSAGEISQIASAGPGVDALHQLIQDIRKDLVRGVQVEFRLDGATASTFFDLEAGRLEEEFEYWVATNSRMRCVLRLWTRPYGHTGTSRSLIASAQASGPVMVPATGVLGDVNARTVLTVSASSARNNRIAMWGVRYPAASGFRAIYNPSQIDDLGSASVFGASGRWASQYLGKAVTPTAAAQDVFSLELRPQDAGRYRLFADMRTRFGGAASAAKLSVYVDQEGIPVSGVATLSIGALQAAGGTGWKCQDLGEITVPSVIRLTSLYLQYLGASGASAVATYPIQIADLILLPVDRAAGVFVPSSAYLQNSNSWLYIDGVSNEVRVGVGLASAGVTAEQFLRGRPIEIPAVGSPMASGPAQVVIAVRGNASDSPTNDIWHYEVAVRERFSFLR